MTSGTCTRCGSRFYREPDAEWKRLCLDCWKATKARTAHRTKGDADECLRWYRNGFEAGRAAALVEVSPSGEATIDAARLRQLIRLCHPDLHGGSDLATGVTAWLLGLREKVTA